MGDYVVLKTHRVMPWKFEFLNEVYNTLALAYTDRYIKPNEGSSATESKKNMSLMQLLRIPTDKNKDRSVSFVFGDKSTYTEPDATDYTLIAYK